MRVLTGWCDFVLIYSCALYLHNVGVLLVGFRETLRAARSARAPAARRRMYSSQTPAISLVAPAFNEESSIVQSVRSFLSLNYPEFEVVIVNDGSTDGTLSTLIESFELYPVECSSEQSVPTRPVRGTYRSRQHRDLLVIDKENGGKKADATNAGLNFARHPLVCVTDADSVLEGDALLSAVRPFVEDPEHTQVVGGTIRIANGCAVQSGRIVRPAAPRNLLARIQSIEYLRAFLLGRAAWSWGRGLLIVSGAFGLFRRRELIDSGGFSMDTLAEDMELVVRMHRRLSDVGVAYGIRFVADPVCWTEVPEKLRVLRRQRMRWHQGLLEVLWQYRGMIGRPRYGVTGLLALPCAVLFEALGPLIELTGLVLVPACWALGVLDTTGALALLLITIGLGVAVSLLSVLLDDIAFRRQSGVRELFGLCAAALLENLGYRQLTACWRAQATLEFFRRRRVAWGDMERRGLGRT